MAAHNVKLVSIAAASLCRVANVGRREMRDVFREGMLGTNAAGVDAACFASLGEGVVAGVEVFALFQDFG